MCLLCSLSHTLSNYNVFTNEDENEKSLQIENKQYARDWVTKFKKAKFTKGN